MEWERAGEAWGNRALDWAYLFEPYTRVGGSGVRRHAPTADVAPG